MSACFPILYCLKAFAFIEPKRVSVRTAFKHMEQHYRMLFSLDLYGNLTINDVASLQGLKTYKTLKFQFQIAWAFSQRLNYETHLGEQIRI